jgi:hypothetical protein
MTRIRAALGGSSILIALVLVLALVTPPANAQRRVAPSLEAETVTRDKPSEVTVNLSVSRNPISLRRLVVRVRGAEVIDFPYTVPEEKDAKGKQIAPSRNITVKKEEVIFEREFTIVSGQELAANSHHKFTGAIEIPGNLPPSLKGRYSQIRWQARVETDLPGGVFFGADPTSSWIDLNVR